MIHFRDIYFKNFLSVGDQPTHIQLDKAITTIITGTNGSGKSTFIDALVYALYGKPFRKVKLGQLINKVNEKGLEVEISFSIGNKDYTVKRGQKPALFEIYVGGVLIEQPATTADYQSILENDILKLNYKTFTQIIVLGSASFTPFMQLKLADRREVIENLLDISVFTGMNTILKSNIKDKKDEILEAEHQMELLKERYKSKREYFQESTVEHKRRVESIESDIKIATEQIRLRGIDKSGHEEYIDELENSMLGCEGYEDAIINISADIAKLETDIALDEVTVETVEGNSELVKSIEKKINDCKNLLADGNHRIKKLIDDLNDNEDVIESFKVQDITTERDNIRSAIAILSNEVVAKKVKVEFYEKNDDCPECKQGIDTKFKEGTITSLHDAIINEEKELDTYNDRLNQIDQDLKDHSTFIDKKTHIKNDITTLRNSIEQWKSSVNLMDVDISTREVKTESELNDIKVNIDRMKSDVYNLSNERAVLKEKNTEFVVLKDKLTDVYKNHALTLQTIDNHERTLIILQRDLKNLNDAPACSVTQEDIDEFITLIKDIDKDIAGKRHILHYFGIVQRLLKDDGLKTKIIRKFLPVINATVNMYLDSFDFPINFEFDENFNETIQSKFRNDFSYYSFSEGEKSRIDLALLFTWRETALKKSRSASNIIIFDEIFDGSLDNSGIDNFMSILGLDKEGYSSFIISHKYDVINSSFDRHLDFDKDGHFSKMMEK